MRTRWGSFKGQQFRQYSVVAVAILLAATAAACGNGDDSDGPTDVSIALDWYPWSNHAGIYMAQANGYFKEEGLNVKIYVPADPSTGLQLVGSGQDQFTISYQADVLLARGEGIEARSVAALVQHPLNTIMTLKSSGIERPSQLKGKKVGIAGVASDEPLLSTVLQADGLQLSDVEVVTVGFDLMPALLGKQVDAVLGAYAVHEGILAENQGEPVDVMKIQDWGVPDFYELLLVTSDGFAKEHPETVEKFVRALSRGYAAAQSDPAAAIDEIAKAYPETDKAVENAGIVQLAPLWTDSGAVAWGTQTEERWTNYETWLREQNILTKDVTVDDAFTDEFVEKASD